MRIKVQVDRPIIFPINGYEFTWPIIGTTYNLRAHETLNSMKDLIKELKGISKEWGHSSEPELQTLEGGDPYFLTIMYY